MAKLYKTEGVIIRQMKYGESSMIIDVFTEVKGLRSFIVGGVRSKKSKAALYQVMNLVELVAYDKDSDKLNRIKEAKINLIYHDIPRNIFKSSIASFMIDVFRTSVKEREANLELYHFLKNWLLFLDQTVSSLAYLPSLFMLELSEQLGFQPQNNFGEASNRFNLMEGAFVESGVQMQYILNIDESSHLAHLQNMNGKRNFE